MNKLKELRKNKGVSQQEVADYLNLSRISYLRYENNQQDPSTNTLHKLAEFFGVTSDYILGIDSLPSRKKTHRYEPILGCIPAGTPVEEVENILGYFDLPLDAYPREIMFGLYVDGDSMSPMFMDGDLAIFKKSCVANNGDNVAVRIDGNEVTLKTFRQNAEGIALLPINPNYMPMFFSPQEVENLPIEIIGIAVEIRRNLNKNKRNGKRL